MSAFLSHREPTMNQPFTTHLADQGLEMVWSNPSAAPYGTEASVSSRRPRPNPAAPSAFNGLLGVLRQEDPALERQQRYDFWVRHP